VGQFSPPNPNPSRNSHKQLTLQQTLYGGAIGDEKDRRYSFTGYSMHRNQLHRWHWQLGETGFGFVGYNPQNQACMQHRQVIFTPLQVVLSLTTVPQSCQAHACNIVVTV